ncbi:alpha-hydroxy-acid oxidizing protein [Desulfolutivibrio sulfoxidireducens]|uniref:alpha-hydroxy-acid oxidizing protein n=1 Tax=Desulfolutivibrio sulfoxidireducens TaxID=2773299 RepID=UPI00159E39C7|nr:alpha-hydroxy-acid oxidizing protein [Desulfolutivibrio sulfoxidireducens]QLA17249.1 alpha-hydroxy-acid oxidizing protein [Desulfolutivibrio sulfoxidireducens]QLA20816.1 alpha-hydroxy-acid oxidizing protein [Desulfolutivibrio sulfoxidireducens]
MELGELRKAARERLRGYCRVCRRCDGRACAGEVPGMGGVGTGQGFSANIAALAAWRFNMRVIHGVASPNTAVRLFGLDLSMPVLAAPMTGTTYNFGAPMPEAEFIEALADGCLRAGTVALSGDGADPAMYDSGLAALARHGGRGGAIIKPREHAAVLERISKAEAAGVALTGMDIDGAGLLTMALKGQPVGPKTREELGAIIAATRLPFLVKGIMTVEDAEAAVYAGAAGIVVSNHGGRILDHTPGAAEVLPEIAARVRGRTTILADGGVRTGGDVLKLLALGADAVLVGRPLIVGVVGGGAEGVELLLNKMRGELAAAMILTGTADVTDVDPGIVRR